VYLLVINRKRRSLGSDSAFSRCCLGTPARMFFAALPAVNIYRLVTVEHVTR
jgi:hypothetical protein